MNLDYACHVEFAPTDAATTGTKKNSSFFLPFFLPLPFISYLKIIFTKSNIILFYSVFFFVIIKSNDLLFAHRVALLIEFLQQQKNRKQYSNKNNKVLQEEKQK